MKYLRISYVHTLLLLAGLASGAYILFHRLSQPEAVTVTSAQRRPATVESIEESSTVHIVFDLGNTLVTPKQWSLAFDMCHKDGVNLATLIKYKHRIRSDWYATLEAIGGPQQPLPSGGYLCDDEGLRLPQIMVAWLEGSIQLTTDDIICAIEAREQEGCYENRQHARLMKAMARTTFDRSAHAFGAIPRMIQLLKRLVRNERVQVYILSNWNDQTFYDFIESRIGRTISRYIPREHMVVSGIIGFNKPDPRAFEYLLNTHNIPSHSCIFIDDQAENLQAAGRLGLLTMDARQPANVWKALQRLHLL